MSASVRGDRRTCLCNANGPVEDRFCRRCGSKVRPGRTLAGPCPRCPQDPSAAFCPFCGSPRCPACGQANRPWANFCRGCGARLSEPARRPEPPAGTGGLERTA
jgi:predicted amidophosphoribosyltransferase